MHFRATAAPALAVFLAAAAAASSVGGGPRRLAGSFTGLVYASLPQGVQPPRDAAASEPLRASRVSEEETPDLLRRPVSPEGVAYLRGLGERQLFGATGFDLAALRAGMETRRAPTIPDITLVPARVGDVPGEWVLAPGADPDLRLLYLHGGGFVSGSGGFYLALAAHLSAAVRCAALLPDYRLAPEHRFPAGLEDCPQAHQWLTQTGPAGPAAAGARCRRGARCCAAVLHAAMFHPLISGTTNRSARVRIPSSAAARVQIEDRACGITD